MANVLKVAKVQAIIGLLEQDWPRVGRRSRHGGPLRPSEYEKILLHCRCLTGDEFNRKLDGFGYPAIKLQLHHALVAQKYWTGVLQGRMDIDDDPDERFTVEDMMGYRESVLRLAEQYLSTATLEELATARPMITWGDVEKNLIPAHVVMRTITHLYHHLGQTAAMCRILSKPIAPGMDYPLVP